MLNIARKTRKQRALRPSERNRDPSRRPGTRLTYKQRCHIFTLRDLFWPAERIAASMGLPRTTVQSVLRSGSEVPKKPAGRRPATTDWIRKRLVNRATLDAAHCWILYKQIAQLEGVTAGRKAIVAAFRKELYGRRVVTSKPWLIEA